MPRTNVEPIQFHVPTGQKRIIEEMAKQRSMSLSEYLRFLLETDAHQLGIKVDLDVQHGGGNRQSDA